MLEAIIMYFLGLAHGIAIAFVFPYIKETYNKWRSTKESK